MSGKQINCFLLEIVKKGRKWNFISTVNGYKAGVLFSWAAFIFWSTKVDNAAVVCLVSLLLLTVILPIMLL